ncbi:MAG: hypothetical protein KF715_19555 [Candidatus Didemnitutus sp.]|nr:hypothetical protein [Candidatus Didemnitutus sp.]
MSESPDLHARLLDDARRYDPNAHTRSLLLPYRDVILLQRAKFMSYDQIAATFTRHGLKVSPQGVGAFCRRQFSQAEILRVRRTQATGGGSSLNPGEMAAASVAPASGAPAPQPSEARNGRRGPRIARDDY